MVSPSIAGRLRRRRLRPAPFLLRLIARRSPGGASVAEQLCKEIADWAYLLLALSGACPLLRVKQTSWMSVAMSANDPKRTRRVICVVAPFPFIVNFKLVDGDSDGKSPGHFAWDSSRPVLRFPVDCSYGQRERRAYSNCEGVGGVSQ